jgi:hypothetical protein
MIAPARDLIGSAVIGAYIAVVGEAPCPPETHKGCVMKMKARFKVEFEAEDGSQSPQHVLELALTRAERGLKEIIEEGKPGAARTGIKRNSTRIKTKTKFIK